MKILNRNVARKMTYRLFIELPFMVVGQPHRYSTPHFHMLALSNFLMQAISLDHNNITHTCDKAGAFLLTEKAYGKDDVKETNRH